MDAIIRAWQSYPIVFDILLYFLFFGAVARAALARAFPGQHGARLSITIGLVLAISLATAQHTIGFSLERLGPVAVFVICLALFVTSYKFMANSGTPTWLTVMACVLLVAVMLKAAMPETTEQLTAQYPVPTAIGPLAVLGLLWAASRSYANGPKLPRPDNALVRHAIIPSRRRLRLEERSVITPARKQTKKSAKREKQIGTAIQNAVRLLEREGLTKQTRPKVFEYCERALAEAGKLDEQQAKLVHLDQAIQSFDMTWLNRTGSVNIRQMTPEQQATMRKTLNEERERLQADEEIASLQSEVDKHTGALRAALSKSKECLLTWNAPGGVGWLQEALKEEEHARRLASRILGWERVLHKSLRSQARSASMRNR